MPTLSDIVHDTMLTTQNPQSNVERVHAEAHLDHNIKNMEDSEIFISDSMQTDSHSCEMHLQVLRFEDGMHVDKPSKPSPI